MHQPIRDAVPQHFLVSRALPLAHVYQAGGEIYLPLGVAAELTCFDPDDFALLCRKLDSAGRVAIGPVNGVMCISTFDLWEVYREYPSYQHQRVMVRLLNQSFREIIQEFIVQE